MTNEPFIHRQSLLPEADEQWLEDVVEELMARYEQAGTPLRGGMLIADALRQAYRRGQASD